MLVMAGEAEICPSRHAKDASDLVNVNYFNMINTNLDIWTFAVHPWKKLKDE